MNTKESENKSNKEEMNTKESENKTNKKEMNTKESENKTNKKENKNIINNVDKNIIHKGENKNNSNIFDEAIDWDFNRLMSIYDIKDSTGDGNCLFNSFSLLIFNNESYSNNIRQKICDYLRENKLEDASYIKKMRNDKEYGGESEIYAFCLLCDIKITLYIRNINDINKRSNNDKITIRIYNEHKLGNFSIFMNKYSQNEGLNHFSPCFLKNGSSISNSKLQKIKEIFEKENNYKSYNNSKICNDASNISFGDENNSRYFNLHNHKLSYSNDNSNSFHENKFHNYSTIKNGDKFEKKSNIAKIMSISYMNNFPRKYSLTSKPSILSNPQTNKITNNTSVIQNKKEEGNKIYNDMEKYINDNFKDEKINNLLKKYNKEEEKKFDDKYNQFLKRNERYKNAKIKKEESEAKNLFILKRKIDNKDNVLKTKNIINKEYNNGFKELLRRENQYH